MKTKISTDWTTSERLEIIKEMADIFVSTNKETPQFYSAMGCLSHVALWMSSFSAEQCEANRVQIFKNSKLYQ